MLQLASQGWHVNAGFRVGEWLVRPSLNTISKNGTGVQVEPKVMEVLVCLASCPGESISKETIIKTVWPDTFVSDDSLIRCVSELRRVFEDDARAPAVIQTIPKRGYRLLIPAVPIGRVNHQTVPLTPQIADSIAVLPFENSESDPEMEYLIDGVAETVINSLSRVQSLRVVPRTTVFRHKGRGIDPITTGRDLGSRVVLTGQIVQRADRLIVQTELIDAPKGSLVWGEKYDCKPADILAVQQEIVEEVLNRLQLRLGETERVRLNRAPTESREAYLLFLKAVHFANKWTPEGFQKGFAYTRQAIDADPTFAGAYTSLAYLYLLMAFFGDTPPSETFPKAKAAALKALDIDDSLADAHAALAFAQLVYDWDWQNSHAELCRAIKLGPNLESGHYALSNWYITRGLCHEGIAEASVALSIDPLSAKLNFHLGGVYYFARQWDEAIQEFRKTIELDPLFPPAHQLLACAYARTGMWQDATESSDKGLALSGGTLRSRSLWAAAHTLMGKHLDEVRKVLEQLKRESGAPHFQYAFACASLQALLGERGEAFEWLERAYRARAGNLVYLGVDPHFENLHGDPRFGDLLYRIGVSS